MSPVDAAVDLQWITVGNNHNLWMKHIDVTTRCRGYAQLKPLGKPQPPAFPSCSQSAKPQAAEHSDPYSTPGVDCRGAGTTTFTVSHRRGTTNGKKLNHDGCQHGDDERSDNEHRDSEPPPSPVEPSITRSH